MGRENFLKRLLRLRITLQQSHDRGVALGALYEFLEAQLAVFVTVHLSEDFVGALFGRAFVLWHLHNGAYHFVDCRDYFQHLLPGYVTIAVEIVHGEGPLEFLFEFAPGCDRESAQELPEIDGAVAVGVKCAENVLGEFRSVTVREEVAVDLLEFVDG